MSSHCGSNSIRPSSSRYMASACFGRNPFLPNVTSSPPARESDHDRTTTAPLSPMHRAAIAGVVPSRMLSGRKLDRSAGFVVQHIENRLAVDQSGVDAVNSAGDANRLPIANELQRLIGRREHGTLAAKQRHFEQLGRHRLVESLPQLAVSHPLIAIARQPFGHQTAVDFTQGGLNRIPPARAEATRRSIRPTERRTPRRPTPAAWPAAPTARSNAHEARPALCEPLGRAPERRTPTPSLPRARFSTPASMKKWNGHEAYRSNSVALKVCGLSGNRVAR